MLALLFTLAAAIAPGGTLVIAGGALDAGNAAVFDALIPAMPAGAPDIVIVPAASAAPATSAASFRRDLERHGVAAERIAIAQVAMVDDPATADVDESAWRDGGSDPREVARLAHAGAIWFVGGDQARIVAILVGPGGSDTPLLAAIRARLAAGAVVGGTSAGAAIMSRPMIARGDSIGAVWSGSAGAGEEFALAHGLGFLPDGLVDQHFDARGRLGRLVVALSRLAPAERIGFGIDENSALIVDLATHRAHAVGAGAVTIVDARRARFAEDGRFAAEGVALGLASGGDTIDLATGAVSPAVYKRPMAIHGGSPAAPAGGWVAAAIGAVSRDDRPDVDHVAVAGAYGVHYRFTKRAATRGWWGRDPAGIGRYAASGVGLEITPLPPPE